MAWPTGLALARGRRAGVGEGLRRANLHLAAVICVLALLLALPLVDFGALSARNQVARLAMRQGERGGVRLRRPALGFRRRRARSAGRAGPRARGRWRNWPARRRRRPSGPMTITGTTPPRASLECRQSRVQPENPALEAQVLRLSRANPWQCSEYVRGAGSGPTAGGRRESRWCSAMAMSGCWWDGQSRSGCRDGSRSSRSG